MTGQAPYEVFAIKYGERTGERGRIFLGGDPHDAPLDMDYFLWVVRNDERTVVVDVGYGRPEGEARGRTFLRTPAEALALVEVDAASVTDVVLTHLHYDHAGNLDSFPSARFHVQERELAYVTGRSMRYRALNHSFRLDDVLEVVRLLYADRVEILDGDTELAPGIGLHHIGGHTPGQMSVSVATPRGRVVVASDAAHYYESFEQERVFTTHESVTEMLEGYRRLRALADSDDHVVPGHDPLVLDRYPPPSADLAGVVAALHRSPHRETAMANPASTATGNDEEVSI